MKTDLEAAQTLLGPGMLRSAPGGPGQMASKGPGRGPAHGTPLCKEIFYIPGRHTQGCLKCWLQHPPSPELAETFLLGGQQRSW